MPPGVAVPSGSEDHQQGDADHIAVNPVVVALLVDPIGDRHRLIWHLKSFAEGTGEALQLGPGQSPQTAVEVLDRLGIKGQVAGISRR